MALPLLCTGTLPRGLHTTAWMDGFSKHLHPSFDLTSRGHILPCIFSYFYLKKKKRKVMWVTRVKLAARLPPFLPAGKQLWLPGSVVPGSAKAPGLHQPRGEHAPNQAFTFCLVFPTQGHEECCFRHWKETAIMCSPAETAHFSGAWEHEEFQRSFLQCSKYCTLNPLDSCFKSC